MIFHNFEHYSLPISIRKQNKNKLGIQVRKAHLYSHAILM